MGYNTTIVVMNDALADIESDPDFGKNVARAIQEIQMRAPGTRVDISSGCHANAAHVVETHHADHTVLVTVGGNLGIRQHDSYGWHHHEKEGQVKLLKEWATKLGFNVTPVVDKAPS